MSACKICGKEKSCYAIELEEEEEKYSLPVCGTCWDIVAKIAQLATNERINKLEAQVKALLAAVPSAKVER